MKKESIKAETVKQLKRLSREIFGAPRITKIELAKRGGQYKRHLKHKTKIGDIEN